MRFEYSKMEERKDILQEFIVKAIGLISDTKGLQSSGMALSFGISSSEPKWVRDSLRKNFSVKKQLIFLDLVQVIENCHPLLTERWQFAISIKRILKNIDPGSQQRVISEALSLVSLKSSSITHPGLAGLSLSLNHGSSELLPWDSECSRQLSSSIAKVDTNDMACEISVEYLNKLVKPKLLQARLGARPRLVSFDTEREDSPRSRASSSSTEVSHADFNLRGFVNNQKVSLIESEGFLEEREVGFKLMGSQLGSDKDSASEGENSFELTIQECPVDEMSSEDVRIAAYKSLCKLAMKSKAFNGMDSIFRQISASLEEWEQVKNA